MLPGVAGPASFPQQLREGISQRFLSDGLTSDLGPLTSGSSHDSRFPPARLPGPEVAGTFPRRRFGPTPSTATGGIRDDGLTSDLRLPTSDP